MSGAAAIPPTVANALRERDFERQVIDLARQYQWECAHWSDSRREVRRGDGSRVLVGDRNAAGFPDWILCRPPAIIVAELKAERGRLSDKQRRWLQLLEMCGIETHVWKPSDWPSIQERLARSAHA